MDLMVRIRDHVPVVAGLLTVISLFLIFGAVRQTLPGLPRAPDPILAAIPHLNAVISVVAIATITGGWRWIRRGAVRRHRAAMLVSVALFGVFLTLYLYRVSLVGPTAFAGPAFIRTFVYLPILTIHILLAIVCLPLLYYVALLGLSRPVADIYQTNHSYVGRIAAVLWLTSFVLGLVVYTALYLLWSHG